MEIVDWTRGCGCCGRAACDSFRRCRRVVRELEGQLTLAATLGKQLIERNEEYIADKEEEIGRLHASIEQLQASEAQARGHMDQLEQQNAGLEAENTTVIAANKALLNNLERLNSSLAYADSHIDELTEQLDTANTQLRALHRKAQRAEALEAEMRALEEQCAALQLEAADERTCAGMFRDRWLATQTELDRLAAVVAQLQDETALPAPDMVKLIDDAAAVLEWAPAPPAVPPADRAELQASVDELKALLHETQREISELRARPPSGPPAAAQRQPLRRLSMNRLRHGPRKAVSQELHRPRKAASQELHHHHHIHIHHADARTETPMAVRKGRSLELAHAVQHEAASLATPPHGEADASPGAWEDTPGLVNDSLPTPLLQDALLLTPATPNGTLDARRRSWWGETPSGGGLRTKKADVRRDREGRMEALMHPLTPAASGTSHHRTHSGGRHMRLRAPFEYTPVRRRGSLDSMLDVVASPRVLGSYSPSTHHATPTGAGAVVSPAAEMSRFIASTRGGGGGADGRRSLAQHLQTAARKPDGPRNGRGLSQWLPFLRKQNVPREPSTSPPPRNGTLYYASDVRDDLLQDALADSLA